MEGNAVTPRLQQELAEALVRERERLHRSLRLLGEAERELSESQREESGPAGDAGDIAADVAERDVDLVLERAERDRLAEVEAALTRLADGQYGTCQTCGQPIPVERLYALPWARQCVQCASQAAGRRR